MRRGERGCCVSACMQGSKAQCMRGMTAWTVNARGRSNVVRVLFIKENWYNWEVKTDAQVSESARIDKCDVVDGFIISKKCDQQVLDESVTLS